MMMIYIHCRFSQLEDLFACMKDEDNDAGSQIPSEGAIAGTDCNDEDPNVDPADLDNDGLSTCDGDCDDFHSYKNIDNDGDGFTTCDGDCNDEDPP